MCAFAELVLQSKVRNEPENTTGAKVVSAVKRTDRKSQ